MTQLPPSGPAPFVTSSPVYYVAAPPTNILAILAFVASLIGFHLVGVIMGHIALAQIKRTAEGGRALAIAGVVIGYVFLGLWVVLLLVWLVGVIVAIVASVLIAGSSAAYDY